MNYKRHRQVCCVENVLYCWKFYTGQANYWHNFFSSYFSGPFSLAYLISRLCILTQSININVLLPFTKELQIMVFCRGTYIFYALYVNYVNLIVIFLPLLLLLGISFLKSRAMLMQTSESRTEFFIKSLKEDTNISKQRW